MVEKGGIGWTGWDRMYLVAGDKGVFQQSRAGQVDVCSECVADYIFEREALLSRYW